MKDFFISYTKADKAWAEWIAWTLEAAGYSTVIQAWDFRPGSNFVLEMQRAATEANRTIAVLSQKYLESIFTLPEWAAAFAQDPQGKKQKLVPIRVAPCELTGILAPIVYLDLIGLPEEDARASLLGAFTPARNKPTSAPAFPGGTTQEVPGAAPAKPFPAEGQTTASPITQSLENLVSSTQQNRQASKLSPDERLALIRQLNAMLSQHFNMLVVTLNPEPGLIPEMPAPQADRSVALVKWAESPSGCGLSVLQKFSLSILDPVGSSEPTGALPVSLKFAPTNLPERDRIEVSALTSIIRSPNFLGSIGSLFKGRDRFLQRLQTALETSPEGHAATFSMPKAIHGLGGVGKTRVAVEYGLRHQNEYTALLLIPADSSEALRRNFADLAGSVVVDLEGFTGSEEEVRLTAVLRWLEQHPHWFLILDNVDSETAAIEVEELLGRLHGGHVLITTRVSTWSGQVETLELGLLDEAAAVAFLEEGTRQRTRTATDAQDVRTLAQTLGGLALALQQASAHINNDFTSFGDYLRTWRKTQQDVMEWFDERLMGKLGCRAPVAITWQTTFDQLKGPARALLGLLSYFASAPIPRGALKTEEYPGILATALATTPGASASDSQPLSEQAVNSALAELGKFSLVRFLETPPETFSLHRLVQEIARFRLGDAARLRSEQALALVQASVPRDSRDASTWPQWAALAPHLERLFEATKGGTDYPQAANLLSGFADYLMYRGATPATALGYYERALALHRQLGDRGAEGRDLTGMGYCESTLGDNARAREHFLQAVDIHHVLGHLREEGDARCGLGYAHSGLSSYPEALAEFAKARDIHRQIENSRGEGEALCGMGAPLWDLGRFKAAEEAHQQALPIHRAAQDTKGEADVLMGLGWCCWGQGKYRQGVSYFEKALSVHREIDDQEGIISDLCGLGDAWASLGNFDRGAAFLREGLEFSRKSGDRGWESACLWGLGYASQQTGDHRKAIEILEGDLALSRDHLDGQRGVACDLNALGESHAKLEEIEPARACFEEALTISRAIGDGWGEAYALHGLGTLSQAAGDIPLAITRYERALELIRSVDELPRERDILRDLGEALAALGQAERAADCQAQAERLSRQLEEWNRLPDH